MDINGLTQSKTTDKPKRKELILEARHSRAIELANIKRSKLSCRLFMPKTPVNIYKYIPRTPKLSTKLWENKLNHNKRINNLATEQSLKTELNHNEILKRIKGKIEMNTNNNNKKNLNKNSKKLKKLRKSIQNKYGSSNWKVNLISHNETQKKISINLTKLETIENGKEDILPNLGLDKPKNLNLPGKPKKDCLFLDNLLEDKQFNWNIYHQEDKSTSKVNEIKISENIPKFDTKSYQSEIDKEYFEGDLLKSLGLDKPKNLNLKEKYTKDCEIYSKITDNNPKDGGEHIEEMLKNMGLEITDNNEKDNEDFQKSVQRSEDILQNSIKNEIYNENILKNNDNLIEILKDSLEINETMNLPRNSVIKRNCNLENAVDFTKNQLRDDKIEMETQNSETAAVEILKNNELEIDTKLENPAEPIGNLSKENDINLEVQNNSRLQRDIKIEMETLKNSQNSVTAAEEIIKNNEMEIDTKLENPAEAIGNLSKENDINLEVQNNSCLQRDNKIEMETQKNSQNSETAAEEIIKNNEMEIDTKLENPAEPIGNLSKENDIYLEVQNNSRLQRDIKIEMETQKSSQNCETAAEEILKNNEMEINTNLQNPVKPTETLSKENDINLEVQNNSRLQRDIKIVMETQKNSQNCEAAAEEILKNNEMEIDTNLQNPAEPIGNLSKEYDINLEVQNNSRLEKDNKIEMETQKNSQNSETAAKEILKNNELEIDTKQQNPVKPTETLSKENYINLEVQNNSRLQRDNTIEMETQKNSQNSETAAEEIIKNNELEIDTNLENQVEPIGNISKENVINLEVQNNSRLQRDIKIEMETQKNSQNCEAAAEEILKNNEKEIDTNLQNPAEPIGNLSKENDINLEVQNNSRLQRDNQIEMETPKNTQNSETAPKEVLKNNELEMDTNLQNPVKPTETLSKENVINLEVQNNSRLQTPRKSPENILKTMAIPLNNSARIPLTPTNKSPKKLTLKVSNKSLSIRKAVSNKPKHKIMIYSPTRKREFLRSILKQKTTSIYNNENYVNYNKSTRYSYNEFKEIVVKTMADVNGCGASASSSIWDMEIYNNLNDIENSINDFAKFLIDTYKDIEDLEAKAHDEVAYFTTNVSYDFQESTRNSAISENSSAATSSALENTECASSSYNFVVQISAPEIPEQTLTFKTSEIVKPKNVHFETTLGFETELPQEDCTTEVIRNYPISSEINHENTQDCTPVVIRNSPISSEINHENNQDSSGQTTHTSDISPAIDQSTYTIDSETETETDTDTETENTLPVELTSHAIQVTTEVISYEPNGLSIIHSPSNMESTLPTTVVVHTVHRSYDELEKVNHENSNQNIQIPLETIDPPIVDTQPCLARYKEPNCYEHRKRKKSECNEESIPPEIEKQVLSSTTQKTINNNNNKTAKSNTNCYKHRKRKKSECNEESIPPEIEKQVSTSTTPKTNNIENNNKAAKSNTKTPKKPRKPRKSPLEIPINSWSTRQRKCKKSNKNLPNSHSSNSVKILNSENSMDMSSIERDFQNINIHKENHPLQNAPKPNNPPIIQQMVSPSYSQNDTLHNARSTRQRKCKKPYSTPNKNLPKSMSDCPNSGNSMTIENLGRYFRTTNIPMKNRPLQNAPKANNPPIIQPMVSPPHPQNYPLQNARSTRQRKCKKPYSTPNTNLSNSKSDCPNSRNLLRRGFHMRNYPLQNAPKANNPPTMEQVVSPSYPQNDPLHNAKSTRQRKCKKPYSTPNTNLPNSMSDCTNSGNSKNMPNLGKDFQNTNSHMENHPLQIAPMPNNPPTMEQMVSPSHPQNTDIHMENHPLQIAPQPTNHQTVQQMVSPSHPQNTDIHMENPPLQIAPKPTNPPTVQQMVLPSHPQNYPLQNAKSTRQRKCKTPDSTTNTNLPNSMSDSPNSGNSKNMPNLGRDFKNTNIHMKNHPTQIAPMPNNPPTMQQMVSTSHPQNDPLQNAKSTTQQNCKLSDSTPNTNLLNSMSDCPNSGNSMNIPDIERDLQNTDIHMENHPLQIAPKTTVQQMVSPSHPKNDLLQNAKSTRQRKCPTPNTNLPNSMSDCPNSGTSMNMPNLGRDFQNTNSHMENHPLQIAPKPTNTPTWQQIVSPSHPQNTDIHMENRPLQIAPKPTNPPTVQQMVSPSYPQNDPLQNAKSTRQRKCTTPNTNLTNSMSNCPNSENSMNMPNIGRDFQNSNINMENHPLPIASMPNNPPTMQQMVSTSHPQNDPLQSLPNPMSDCPNSGNSMNMANLERGFQKTDIHMENRPLQIAPKPTNPPTVQQMVSPSHPQNDPLQNVKSTIQRKCTTPNTNLPNSGNSMNMPILGRDFPNANSHMENHPLQIAPKPTNTPTWQQIVSPSHPQNTDIHMENRPLQIAPKPTNPPTVQQMVSPSHPKNDPLHNAKSTRQRKCPTPNTNLPNSMSDCPNSGTSMNMPNLGRDFQNTNSHLENHPLQNAPMSNNSPTVQQMVSTTHPLNGPLQSLPNPLSDCPNSGNSMNIPNIERDFQNTDIHMENHPLQIAPKPTNPPTVQQMVSPSHPQNDALQSLPNSMSDCPNNGNSMNMPNLGRYFQNTNSHMENRSLQIAPKPTNPPTVQQMVSPSHPQNYPLQNAKSTRQRKCPTPKTNLPNSMSDCPNSGNATNIPNLRRDFPNTISHMEYHHGNSMNIPNLGIDFPNTNRHMENHQGNSMNMPNLRRDFQNTYSHMENHPLQNAPMSNNSPTIIQQMISPSHPQNDPSQNAKSTRQRKCKNPDSTPNTNLPNSMSGCGNSMNMPNLRRDFPNTNSHMENHHGNSMNMPNIRRDFQNTNIHMENHPLQIAPMLNNPRTMEQMVSPSYPQNDPSQNAKSTRQRKCKNPDSTPNTNLPNSMSGCGNSMNMPNLRRDFPNTNSHMENHHGNSMNMPNIRRDFQNTNIRMENHPLQIAPMPNNPRTMEQMVSPDSTPNTNLPNSMSGCGNSMNMPNLRRDFPNTNSPMENHHGNSMNMPNIRRDFQNTNIRMENHPLQIAPMPNNPRTMEQMVSPSYPQNAPSQNAKNKRQRSGFPNRRNSMNMPNSGRYFQNTNIPMENHAAMPNNPPTMQHMVSPPYPQNHPLQNAAMPNNPRTMQRMPSPPYPINYSLRNPTMPNNPPGIQRSLSPPPYPLHIQNFLRQSNMYTRNSHEIPPRSMESRGNPGNLLPPPFVGREHNHVFRGPIMERPNRSTINPFTPDHSLRQPHPNHNSNFRPWINQQISAATTNPERPPRPQFEHIPSLPSQPPPNLYGNPLYHSNISNFPLTPPADGPFYYPPSYFATPDKNPPMPMLGPLPPNLYQYHSSSF